MCVCTGAPIHLMQASRHAPLFWTGLMEKLPFLLKESKSLAGPLKMLNHTVCWQLCNNTVYKKA